MKKITSIFSTNTVPAVVLLLSVVIVLPIVLFAQGSGGAGAGGGTQDQDQVRDLDRDRIQDPTTHDGDEPLQDQDRDRIQDPTLNNSTTPIQDRDQTRDQDRDRIQDPTLSDGDGPLQDRDQDRDRIRVHTPEELRQFINTEVEAGNNSTRSLAEEVQEVTRNRNRVQVAVMSLLAVQDMVGPLGPQVATIAQEIGSAAQVMAQAEEKIEARNWFRRFLFGGDSDSAQTIQEQVRNNEKRVEQIHAHLNACDCTEEVRGLLYEQIQNIETEQIRLRTIADSENSKWGIFSWRFSND